MMYIYPPDKNNSNTNNEKCVAADNPALHDCHCGPAPPGQACQSFLFTHERQDMRLAILVRVELRCAYSITVCFLFKLEGYVGSNNKKNLREHKRE